MRNAKDIYVLLVKVSVKAAGEGPLRKVVSKEEAVMRIKAAIHARSESGTDIVIVGRTDARLAVSFEEALWRMKAFADAGADVVFLDNLFSKDEMKAFCNAVPHVPKLVLFFSIYTPYNYIYI